VRRRSARSRKQRLHNRTAITQRLATISWDARIAVKLRGAGFLHEARAAMYRQRDVF
jgi:hypothetical protein